MIRWLKRVFLGLLALLVAYVGFQLVMWRDLPESTLAKQWYGESPPLTADIGGLRLRYQVEGNGPPVLLLHSHFFSMRMWDAWVEQLAGDFTLVRFDMTSHGLTGPDPSGRYDMDRSLELIEGLLDHLGLDQVSLVGSSLGGNMAFHFAAAHPERVQRLVLINSGGLKRDGSRAGGEIPGWAGVVFRLVPRMAYRRFLEWMVHDDALVSDEWIAEFHNGFRRAGNRPAELERLRAFGVGEPGPVLERVKAPVLVMWGRENPQLPFELAEQFRQSLVSAPDVQVEIVAGAGHVLPMERPLYSAARTRDFLRDRAASVDALPGYRPGPHQMVISGEISLQHADGRSLQARAFHPSEPGRYPLIAFSHGFASDKDQYDRLIAHWVSHGFAVVAGDHEDSGGTAAAIVASIRLGETGLIQSRVQDMSLLLASVDSFPGLRERVDAQAIVGAGHSFGAFTAQMMAGATAIDEAGVHWRYEGPGVAAVIAISPPGEMFDVIIADSWKTQRGPVLMTTGTADIDGRFVTDWRQHLLSFENAQPGQQYALVVDGADHYLGHLIGRLDRDEPAQYEALDTLNMVTTEFLQAFARGDTAALARLEGGPLTTVPGPSTELRRR